MRGKVRINVVGTTSSGNSLAQSNVEGNRLLRGEAIRLRLQSLSGVV